MWAWRVNDFGGIDAMKWKELDEPSISEDEILVHVKASGINFAETRMRAGTYTGIKRPLTLGLEGAGIVDALHFSFTEGISFSMRVHFNIYCIQL